MSKKRLDEAFFWIIIGLVVLAGAVLFTLTALTWVVEAAEQVTAHSHWVVLGETADGRAASRFHDSLEECRETHGQLLTNELTALISKCIEVPLDLNLPHRKNQS